MATGSFQALPREVKILIFVHTAQDSQCVPTLCSVCREWDLLVRSNEFWRSLYVRRWMARTSRAPTWKALYRARHLCLTEDCPHDPMGPSEPEWVDYDSEEVETETVADARVRELESCVEGLLGELGDLEAHNHVLGRRVGRLEAEIGDLVTEDENFDRVIRELTTEREELERERDQLRRRVTELTTLMNEQVSETEAFDRAYRELANEKEILVGQLQSLEILRAERRQIVAMLENRGDGVLEEIRHLLERPL